MIAVALVALAAGCTGNGSCSSPTEGIPPAHATEPDTDTPNPETGRAGAATPASRATAESPDPDATRDSPDTTNNTTPDVEHVWTVFAFPGEEATRFEIPALQEEHVGDAFPEIEPTIRLTFQAAPPPSGETTVPYRADQVGGPFRGIERVDVVTTDGVHELELAKLKRSHVDRKKNYSVLTEPVDGLDQKIDDYTIATPAGEMAPEATYRPVQPSPADEATVDRSTNATPLVRVDHDADGQEGLIYRLDGDIRWRNLPGEPEAR